MKVLIESGTAIATGIAGVMRGVGHQVMEWNKGEKPAFDAFDEYEPDIFFGQGWGRAIDRCVQERPNLLTAHLHNIPFAADTFSFRRGRFRPEMSCEIACLSDTDEGTFDGLIRPLLDTNIKVCGNRRWEIPQYLGPIRKETLCDLYASAKVCLVLQPYEPVYEILASGGLPISFQPHPPEFDDTTLPIAYTLLGFEEMVRKLLRREMDKTRKRYIEVGRKIIFDNHTYWHRVAQVFAEEWNMPDESNRIIKIYHETINF